jgi:hypothetical protein
MTKDFANPMQSVLHLQRLNPHSIIFDFDAPFPTISSASTACFEQFGESNTALP